MAGAINHAAFSGPILASSPQKGGGGEEGRALIEHPIEQKGRSRLFYGWLILPAAVVTMFLFQGSRFSLSVAYPAILNEFGWGRGSTAVIFSFFMLAYGLTDVIAGPLAERYGPKKLMLVGIPILGVALALSSQASELWQLFLLLGALAAVGLGFTGYLPHAVMVSRWFVRRRGMALGILGTGTSLAFLIGLPFQYWISSSGWRGAYLILAILVVGIGLPVVLLVFRSRPQEIGQLPDGVTPNGEADTAIPPSYSLRRWRRSLTWNMKTPRLWLLFGSNALMWGLGWGLLLAHIVAFFQDVGYPEIFAASIFSMFGVIRPLGTLSAFFSDIVGREKMVTLGSVGIVLGVILLLLIDDTSSPWMVYAFVIAFGLGTGLSGPTMVAGVVDIYKKNFGAIYGFILTGAAFGGAIGTWLGGFIFDVTGSYDLAFWLVLVAVVVAVALFWLAAPRREGLPLKKKEA